MIELGLKGHCIRAFQLVTEESPMGEEGQFDLAPIIEISLFM